MMNPAYQCPSCKTLLPPSMPGVVRCPRCQRPATIPDPAVLAKQRADRKHATMLVGLVVGLIYGLPLLMMVGYCAFVIVVYGIMLVAAIAHSA